MAEHTSKKKKSGAKANSFPVGGLVLMLFLLGVIFAAAYFGIGYMSEYRQLKGEYDGALQTAEAKRDSARALCDEADPESASNIERRRQVTEEMIAEACAELDALREQGEATQSAIRAEEEKLAALGDVEDFDYFRAIYDEYVEGRAYVEELLSGD